MTKIDIKPRYYHELSNSKKIQLLREVVKYNEIVGCKVIEAASELDCMDLTIASLNKKIIGFSVSENLFGNDKSLIAIYVKKEFSGKKLGYKILDSHEDYYGICNYSFAPADWVCRYLKKRRT